MQVISKIADPDPQQNPTSDALPVWQQTTHSYFW